MHVQFSSRARCFLWHYFTVGSKDYGIIVQWAAKIMALLYSGQQRLWHYCSVGSKDYDIIVQWAAKIMALLYSGQQILWHYCTVGCKDYGVIVQWAAKIMTKLYFSIVADCNFGEIQFCHNLCCHCTITLRIFQCVHLSTPIYSIF